MEASPDLVLETCAAELMLVDRYPAKQCKHMSIVPFPHLTYAGAGEMLAAQAAPKLQAIGLWALSRTLEQDEVITLPHNGQMFTERMLCIESFRCDPTFSFALNGIGCTLNPGETATLHDGRTLDEIHLYVEALRLNYSPQFLNNLAFSLGPDQRVQMFDGRMMNKLDLYLESQHVFPTYSDSYFALALRIPTGSTLTLKDGRVLNRQQLYVEAISWNTNNASAYCNLANTLFSSDPTNNTIVLADGRLMDRLSLYFEAVRCDPNDSLYYRNIALLLDEGDSLRFPDGRTLSYFEILLEALRCDPQSMRAFEMIVDAVPRDYLWRRSNHSLLFQKETNPLFATLLLAVQRLEEIGVLPLAHQAMLEDMLEGWTWADAITLVSL